MPLVRLDLKRVVVDRPDGRARALTKAFIWRAIGTLDTFILSWIITSHVGAAGAIASLETITKIFLYCVHERLWRAVAIAPNSHARSLFKSISWRAVGSLDRFILSLLVTGNAKHAASIASIEVLTKVVLYELHERVWRRVSWGRLDSSPEPALAEAKRAER
jgi:uncharacterized membrane protein